MSLPQLMTDLAQMGIRIEAHGDRLRYWHRTAVTPDLAEQMKAHKTELLKWAEREEYWRAMIDEDRKHAQSLSPPPPCTWCGGRLRHSKNASPSHGNR